MARLAGNGIIVTGASGIAAASARLFAQEGARVAIVSRTEERCIEVAEAIAADGGEATYAVADLADADATERAGAAVIAWLGRVDGLFNVAGGSGRRAGDGPLHELTAAAWEHTWRLNATSHVLLSAQVLRTMLEQPRDEAGSRGAILNTTSVLASSPEGTRFGTHGYAATKGAIVSLTIASAARYAPDGIRVNALAPALVTSRMSARAGEDADTLAFSRRKMPLVDTFIDPAEVGEAAVYLLSPAARAVTGQILAIDGGWSVTSTS